MTFDALIMMFIKTDYFLWLFLCFADRASQYNLSQWPTWCTKVFNIFITIVYMFRAISFIFFRFCFYQCIYGFIPV